MERKVFSVIFTLVVLLFAASCTRTHEGALKGELKIKGGAPMPLSAGFAATDITPAVPDKWTDADGDAAYDPEKGDTFIDGNGNGMFDPVWIAGFGNRRAANGIHDKLWARTMVLDDGGTRIAIVSLDVIGFMNNAVNDVRLQLPPEAGVSYLVVTSTHSHEGPDLLGLWGLKPVKSGVDKIYLELVKKKIVESVVSAVANLRPARLEFHEDLSGAAMFLRDTRKPEVFDSGLRVIRAADRETNTTLGTFIAWGNHPETLWGKNLMITSDFPHFLRENIEKGIFRGDSLVTPGTGGVAVYSTGAVGGLMTTSPAVAVADPFTGQEYKEPSFEKAEAQGKQLAILVFSMLRKPAVTIDSASISLVARQVRLPLKNKLFMLAKILKVLDRGDSGLRYINSELAVFSLGPATFATIPGEIYPEIINGGIEKPEGGDFVTDPLEVPPVRDMMPGKYKFILGLANDEIGYIIPRSQWDVKAPYTFGRDDAPYGEENSMGPSTAAIIHRNLSGMLEELKK